MTSGVPLARAFRAGGKRRVKKKDDACGSGLEMALRGSFLDKDAHQTLFQQGRSTPDQLWGPAELRQALTECRGNECREVQGSLGRERRKAENLRTEVCRAKCPHSPVSSGRCVPFWNSKFLLPARWLKSQSAMATASTWSLLGMFAQAITLASQERRDYFVFGNSARKIPALWGT